MGILDRIFRKKEKPPEVEKREVDFEGLEGIISGIEEKELKIIEEEGKRITGKVSEAISAFKSGLTVLSDAKLTEEHKERDRRAYDIVKGSKEKITSQLSNAVERIKVPESTDRKALMGLSSSLTEFSKTVARNSKNFFYVSILFGDQMERIKDALKMLDDSQKEIFNCLNSDTYRLLEEIKGRAAETKELYELNGKLAEKEGEIKKLMQKEEEKKEEAERELEKYRKSKEYEDYEKSLLRVNEVKEEMEREEVRIRARISPLMKPLKSLNRIEPDKQKSRLIEGYLENPIEAITREGGLVAFKSILSDLGTAIKERKIKVQSETDIKERIDEIAKADMLFVLVARYAKLKAELEELKEKKFSILKQIEDAEGVLRKDSRERLEKELSKTQQKIERNRENINKRKGQLETLLSKAGHEVRIK